MQEARLQAAALIQKELGSNEHLLWSGKPRGGIRFQSADVFLVPFSILWGGFVIFWEYEAVTKDAPFFFVLWGIPFVLVGLYLIFGRFIVDAKRRENTFYGLTNERVIIISGLFNRTSKTLNLRTLSDISLRQNSDGSGTIAFGPLHPMASWFVIWPGLPATPSFEMIENAKNVYDSILEAQQKAQKTDKTF